MQREEKLGLRRGILLCLLGTFIGGNVEVLGRVMAVNSAATPLVEQLYCTRHYREGASDFILACTELPAALGQGERLMGSRWGRPVDSNLAVTLATTPSLQDLAVAFNAPSGRGGIVTNALERMRNTPEEYVGVSAGTVESVLDVQAGAEDTIIARFGQDNAGEFQSLAEIRTAKTLMTSGNELGRGAL